MATTSLDTAKIEQLTGSKGKLDTAENVFKVTVPRSDLVVNVAGESPRILFLHYWGEGHAVDLAKAFKAALDTQSKN